MIQAPSVKIEIEQFADGRFTVIGPLENDLVCYGLLTKAIQYIKHMTEQKKPMQASILAVPKGLDLHAH